MGSHTSPTGQDTGGFSHTPADYAGELPAIRVDDVHAAFTAILLYFRPQHRAARRGVSPGATIADSAVIGSEVDIHAGAVIGDDVQIASGATIHAGVCISQGSRIGQDVTIFPNAVLYENTVVGPRTIIHAGVVLGAHGFGYKLVDGRHEPTGQLGNVEIAADVEIGAKTTIDRGTYGSTRVGEGTKIDDQVMIGHNCQIGRHNMICAQVGIAGSTSTGDYVVMAGQVGVRDHVVIGDQVVLGAKAGVINNVPDGAHMVGIPATLERDQKIKQAVFSKLPEMRRQLRALQKTVDALTDQTSSKQRPSAA